MDPQSDLSSIRIVVLGGEPALASDHQLFRRHFLLDALLVNGLGPTESTLTLQYFMDHSTVINTDKLKVGYPVAGTEILLLDDEGAETEVYGEIAIKSPHVAVEYWRRPDLTSAAFPVDVEGSGSRIYRTGDSGHRYADGSFGFCGRRDHQVKVRGFRIELGEIEAALAQHPDILECAVVARMDGKGDQTAVAYIVPRTPNPTSHELKQFLRNRIPHFIVPSAFVRLESFTLTESGKVNRQLLPPVNDDHMGAERKFVTPRTATEARLAAIWRKMSATDSVGADDDFFDLGGHSLAASRVVSRIRLVFGNEISLRQFFEHPTLEALAALVDNRAAP